MKHLSTILIIAVLLFAASVIMTQTSQGNDAAVASSDPAIVERLRTIVTIRERLAESNKRAMQSGKGETDGRYELALAEARLRLARELGQRPEQVAALKDILKVHQRRLEDAKKQSEVGVVSPDDIDIVRVAVLEAEVRLLRAQNNSKKP
jgi:outer membrane efflux protein